MAKINSRGIWNEGGFGTRPYKFTHAVPYQPIIPKCVITSKN